MDTAMMLLFCLVLVFRQVFVGANITCLDKEANDTLISLNCTVDNLDYGIVFTYPNDRRGQAYCVVPVLEDTLCDCSCNSTPACNCSITQDISTNITSLQIWGTNLTDMFGWYTCAHGSYKKSIMVTRHVLWFETNVNNEMIQLSCTPDEFTSRIDFYFPKNVGHAYCKAPRPSTRNFNCSCDTLSASKCNIFQDIATKTTTLEIYYKNLTSMFGRYICVHGFDSRSTMVTRTSIYRQDNDYCPVNTEVATIVVPTMSLTAVIVISIFIWLFPDIPGRTKECIFGVQVEKDHVLFKKKCRVCENLTTCAICIECKQGFCDPCCDKHLKFDKNRLHKVYQIQHVATSQEITKCDITKCKKKAERVCISCWVQRCVSCVSKDHGDKCDKKEIIRIHQTTTPESPIPQTTEQDNLKLLRTIPIQKDKYPVRIYGIEFLADGTLVAIDKNNKQIILFTADFKQQFVPLENEPRAMTAMAGNDIAVTFPCIQHIKIYAIYWNSKKDTATCEITKVIKMSNLDLHILKPFSITFNKDFFAVEVGEGEDGKIVIVDNNNNKTYNFPETIQWKFAYFTGHTIRLALAIDRKHMNNRPQGRLYMSTMSNKMVSCIDLEGNEKWEVSMPSPRSLIIVPKKHQFGDSIILSSRRFNAIYTLEKIDGKNEVLQASEIESPRYIACHFEKNTFCVLVKNKEKKDELAIFGFKNKTKQDDADKALEFNESTNLLHV